MKAINQKIENNYVNVIRCLSADIVQKANSGHPGAPMGCAPMVHVLFDKIMNYDPENPDWINRDRFVLSNGHSCALLYSILYLTGYEKPDLDDLKNFRQLGSVTAGHPENFLLPGVEVSTGPLGQGISNAVGMAISEKHLAASFNKPELEIINNYTYVICGDGCLQEGVSSEACSLAGHLKLGKLIVLYDDNKITIDGPTNLSFTEDVIKRYQAYGWQVIEVDSGDTNIYGIYNAIKIGKKNADKPTLIKINTTIGFGSEKQGTAEVHGSPLGKEDLQKVKIKFNLNPDKNFDIPEDILLHYRKAKKRGQHLISEWNQLLKKYKIKYPDLHLQLNRRIKGYLPSNWKTVIANRLMTSELMTNTLATRNSSARVLQSLEELIPELIGGSADLTPSNKTKIDKDFQATTPEGRYIRFGVREHGMAAICNGIAAYGGLIPFCSTFLNFANYALGSIRLSALSKFRVLYIMTHDSIGLGEDGPTHQPVEMLVSLRAMPNLYVYRPADSKEVFGSYICALSNNIAPSVLSLSRQSLPPLEGTDASKVEFGAYLVFSTGPIDHPDIILLATGSEVSLSIEAAKEIKQKGYIVNVVSMPCWEKFDQQSKDYQKSVLIPTIPVLSIEASATLGWSKYSDTQLGVDQYGKSAPFEEIYKYFGLTKTNISKIAINMIKQKSCN